MRAVLVPRIKSAGFGLLAALGMFAATTVRANTYDFCVTSAAPGSDACPGCTAPAPGVIGSLTVPASSGPYDFFDYSLGGGHLYQPKPAGLAGGFAYGVTIAGATPYGPYSAPPYPLDIDLTLNPDGTLSGLVNIQDETAGLTLRGSEYAWSGMIGDDPSGNYNITGYWFDPDPSPIPEPSSLALILPAIGVALGLRRRRRLPA
jgi:hypothetical protein